MPFVKRHRTYYKYEYSPNVTKVGSPTIKDNIASGFSSANHLKFPVTITSDSITEGQVCFTTGSDVTTRQGLFLCATTDNSTSFCINGGALQICNKVYGSYPSFVSLGLSVVANTKYYLRFTQNGKSIVPSLSTDGSSYTTGNTVTRSQAFGSNIGYGISNEDVNRPFLGSIDLRNSYIKQSGILFWEGVNKTTSLGSSSDYDDYEDVNKLYNLVRPHRKYYKYGTEPNVTIVGSPTISSGVVSGFTTGNYLTFNTPSKVAAASLNNFEVQFKVTTPSSWTSNGRVLNPTDGADSKTGPFVQVTQDSASLNWYNGSNYQSFRALGALASNKTYWFKWIYDGATIKGYYSVDGEDYVLCSDTAPSYKPFFNSETYGLGIRVSDKSAVCMWKGSIDLTQSYIKVNGEDWWHGTKVVESNESDFDYYKDNLVSYSPIVRNPRKYYKYIYGAWTRPNLSSDGTLGGSSFAVSRTGGGGTTMTGSTYASMDGNTGTSCKFAYSSNGSAYTFYNPKPLLLSSLSFTYYDGNIGYGIKSGSLQASNDNSSWETLATFTSNLSTWQINATKHYKYFKINITDGYDVMLTEIYVNAKQLVETVESTSDDYSYYVDSVKLY